MIFVNRDNTVECRIARLKPYTEYYYRLVLDYGDDTIYGDIMMFRTLDNGIQYVKDADLDLSVLTGQAVVSMPPRPRSTVDSSSGPSLSKAGKALIMINTKASITV